MQISIKAADMFVIQPIRATARKYLLQVGLITGSHACRLNLHKNSIKIPGSRSRLPPKSDCFFCGLCAIFPSNMWKSVE